MNIESDAIPIGASLSYENKNDVKDKLLSKHNFGNDISPSIEEKTLPNNSIYEIKSDIKDGHLAIDDFENIEQFVERTQLLISPLEYAREGTDPGLVLIFNQENFKYDSKRFGSQKDVSEIILCMGRLGFNISKSNVFTDLRKNEITDAIQEILIRRDLSKVNALIVFFLTHGDSLNTLHAYDDTLEASELWTSFTKCKQLKNKPKMFILQACKGKRFSKIDNPGKVPLVPKNALHSLEPDMLIIFSSTEDNVAFRDVQNGSWFIQELMKNFSSYGRRDDVVNLAIRTTKCVCRNYFYKDGKQIKKQMPLFISTLTKKFYLNRNKERNLLLDLNNKYENLVNVVTELQCKVDLLFDMYKEKNK